MDTFGIRSMFISFGALLTITVFVIATQFPERPASRRRATDTVGARSLLSFELLWFFANLFVYGMCMSLVETFLFVFLLREFKGTSHLLLGGTVFVMCVGEVPVFRHVDKAFKYISLTGLLSFCHHIFAVRCVLYAFLPRAYAFTVLLVEPLHGITFACMWSCSVEYGKRLTPEGSKAKMQALMNGLYYRLALGAGSLCWGPLTEQPPRGYGFTACFFGAAVLMLSWSFIWNIGWVLRRRRLPSVPLQSCATGADE